MPSNFTGSTRTLPAPVPTRRARSARSERGIVLIWAAAVTLIVAGVVISGTDRIKALDEVTRAEFSAQGQAHQVAEAGLVDAYAWFRRQQVQPVSNFAPRRDLAASPPANETDDATQGLLRTFEISPGLWARYRVQAGAASEPYVDGDANGHYDAGEAFTDVNGDGRWTPAHDTRDVTVARGLPGVGTVWEIVSRAQVFRRPRADMDLGEGENVQVAEATLCGEVRRLTIAPPASATLCSSTSSAVTIGNRARLRSNAACIAYGVNSGSVSLLSGSSLLGSPASTLVPNFKDSVDDVFGVDWTVLKSMADISTTDPVLGVPGHLPTMSLVVVTGNITFDMTRPLKGTAIMVVKGNVTIDVGSNSFFNGLLYVEGNLTVRAPALLRGTIIVRNGVVDVRGTGGDFVEVERDTDILNSLLTVMGQYRHSKAPFEPAHLMADGRPDEQFNMRRRPGTGN